MPRWGRHPEVSWSGSRGSRGGGWAFVKGRMDGKEREPQLQCRPGPQMFWSGRCPLEGSLSMPTVLGQWSMGDTALAQCGSRSRWAGSRAISQALCLQRAGSAFSCPSQPLMTCSLIHYGTNIYRAPTVCLAIADTGWEVGREGWLTRKSLS